MRNHTLLRTSVYILLGAVGSLAPQGDAQTVDVQAIATEIRTEFLRSNDDPDGRPLPLAAHWSMLEFNPEYTLDKVRQGHYVLPSFQLLTPVLEHIPPTLDHEQTMMEVCGLGLPFAMRSSQYEEAFALPEYRELPFETSPYRFFPNGTKDFSKLDIQYPSDVPFFESGRRQAQTEIMRRYYNLCASPSGVLFLSNNENPWLRWYELEDSKRYTDEHGFGTSSSDKISIYDDLADTNILQDWPRGNRSPIHRGISSELSEGWQGKNFFVGYNAFGPRFYGRWWDWWSYSSNGLQHPSLQAAFWDGASVDFYLDDWNGNTDSQAWSMQVEAQNWVFMQKKARETNPDFWFELSTWDGGHANRISEKLTKHLPFDQVRYGAMIRFGMWLLQPRVVREFRSSHQPVSLNGSYFDAVIDAVDEVHNNPTLRQYWRQGELVSNQAHVHPYQQSTNSNWESEERYFMLDTNLDPPRPWALYSTIPIFAIAQRIGESPNRSWLLYAHAPTGSKQDVQITIPEYGEVSVDVPLAGAFYVVVEGSQVPQRVDLGPLGTVNSPPVVHATNYQSSGPRDLSMTMEISDPNGNADLVSAEFRLGDRSTDEYGCRVSFLTSADTFHLHSLTPKLWRILEDADVSAGGCGLKLAGTHATQTNSTLTLSVDLEVTGFAPGTYDLAVRAEDRYGNILPWENIGTFTVESVLPIGIWRFDEPGDGIGIILADESGRGNAATTVGTEFLVEGARGGARRFRGFDDYVFVEPNADYTSESFSMSAWVKVDSLPDSWSVLYSNYNGNYRGSFLALTSSGHIALAVCGYTETWVWPPSRCGWIVSEHALRLGEWQHIGATLNGQSRRGRVYVGGRLSKSGVYSAWTPPVRGTVAPTFGKATWTQTKHFRGALDEIEIYPIELSQAAVQSLAVSLPSSQSDPLVASWSFDEAGDGPGITLNDSQNGYNATTAGYGTLAEPEGVLGGARRFDGHGHYATLDANPGLSPETFTFRAWVKLNTDRPWWSVLFSNYGNDGGEYQGWFLGVAANDHLILAVCGASSTCGWLVSNTPLTPGAWQHVAVTFDGATRTGKIYLDGTSDRSGVFPAWTPQTLTRPTFGRASWYSGAYFYGALDEIDLHSFEFTPQEIKNDYDSFLE